MSDNLRQEYDFSKLGEPARGKYAKAFKSGTNLVLLDEDVARAFPDGKSINEALRLGRFFGVGPLFWLNLQSRYDLETAEEVLAGSLEQEVTPFENLAG